MRAVYLLTLLISTGCLALLDARFRLVFRSRPVRAGIALAIGLGFFIIWDLVGIEEGVFRHLDSRWATGILLAPAFPIEELLFLVFLTYLTLILLSGSHRVAENWQRGRAAGERR